MGTRSEYSTVAFPAIVVYKERGFEDMGLVFVCELPSEYLSQILQAFSVSLLLTVQ